MLNAATVCCHVAIFVDYDAEIAIDFFFFDLTFLLRNL